MNTDNIYKPGDFKVEAGNSVHLVHKNGGHRIVPLGFCWFGFLLPPIWALSEGLWRPFAFSLLVFLAGRIDEIAAALCDQGKFCAVVPFTVSLRLAGFVSYLFAMGYFGFNGKKFLVEDLLRHGYFVEGMPRPVEPDEEDS